MSNQSKINLPKNIKKNKLEQFKAYYEIMKLNDKNLKSINPQSLINTLATIFELNLSNSPIKREIALIPYGNDLQVQIQEDGWLSLLERTKLVVDFQREKITSNHIFNSKNNRWELNPAKIFERKNVTTIGYYAFISIKNINGEIVNFYKGMTVEECQEWRRKYSKANNNSPWVTNFDAMALKTVVKAVIRDINKTPNILLNNQNDINKALQIDQASVVDIDTIKYDDNPNNDKEVIKLNNNIVNQQDNNPNNDTDPFENAQETINEYNVARNKEITQEHINNINAKRQTRLQQQEEETQYNVYEEELPINDFETQQEEIDQLELN